MPTGIQIEAALQNVNDQSSFINTLLRDTLEWRLEEDITAVADIAYQWDENDLQAEGLDKYFVEGSIYQLPPFPSCPWGIFILEFRNADVFTRSRGITTPLRKVLRGLVPRQRRNADLPAFQRNHLLFICTYNYQYYRFAYFRDPEGPSQTPPLASFGWSPEEHGRTICDYNLAALIYPSPLPVDEHDWIAQWAHAFDVEKVTRAFYAEYNEIFKSVETFVKQNTRSAVDEQCRLFTQTLFNRLMFLRFLERKGWLTFNDNRNYLNTLYQAGTYNGESFYKGRLCPLFFKGLAVQGYDNPDQIGSVPFLNGGLFERKEEDDLIDDLPDNLFEKIISKRGLFYRFNFTIEESTPWDIEVAVDPELLGKVFEELVTGRHEKGAFYTPRPVVSFMCREALKGYLDPFIKNSEQSSAFVDHECSDNLNNPEEIYKALQKVKICDPACGSGAYLLGMMQELIRLRSALFKSPHIDARSMYELKEEIIKNNLYGVDLDPFAINIARLRLWLSLAVEYEHDMPEPLPNLDFKIEYGDALTSQIFSMRSILNGDLFNSEIIKSIKKLTETKNQFLSTNDIENKAQLKGKILEQKNTIKSFLTESLKKHRVIKNVREAEAMFSEKIGLIKSFVWNVEFAEVWTESDGFDIVIANPPYVRQELIGDSKSLLRKLYPESSSGKSDLYVYFYSRGLDILRQGGMHVFICSNSWLDVGFGAKLQQYLLTNANIRAIYDSAVERQFSTASINTIISILRKGEPSPDAETRFIYLQDKFDMAIHDPQRQRIISKTWTEIVDSGIERIDDKPDISVPAIKITRYIGDKWGGKYLRAPDIYWTIMKKGKGKLVRLGDIAEVRRGFTTGANEFFYLDQAKIDEWGIEEEFLKPVLKSAKDSDKILIDPKLLRTNLFYCHDNYNDIKGTNAFDYIKWGERIGYNKVRSVQGRKYWYDVGRKKPADGIILRRIGERCPIFEANGILEDCVLFGITRSIQNIRKHAFLATLNCTWTRLFIEIMTRQLTGAQAVADTNVYLIKDTPVINPNFGAINSIIDSYLAVRNRASLSIFKEAKIKDRLKMDNTLFEIIKLTQGERDAVYEAVIDLVNTRLKKARSV